MSKKHRKLIIPALIVWGIAGSAAARPSEDFYREPPLLKRLVRFIGKFLVTPNEDVMSPPRP